MFDKIINKFRKNESEEGPFDRQKAAGAEITVS